MKFSPGDMVTMKTFEGEYTGVVIDVRVMDGVFTDSAGKCPVYEVKALWNRPVRFFPRDPNEGFVYAVSHQILRKI